MRLIAAVLVGLAISTGASAQGYPEKQVILVVPFPAGGATDPVARAIATRMSELWKQPVVVLNRAGAGGNIGAESVARAAPDGYTLLIGTTSLTIGPNLYAKLGYDVLKDFAPISQATTAPNLLVVHPSLPARSVKELLALARARPGQLISASAGTGTSNHLSLVLFTSLAGVDITHVPYKGAAPAVADTIGGHAHMTLRAGPRVDRAGASEPAAVARGNHGPALLGTAGSPDHRGSGCPRLRTHFVGRAARSGRHSAGSRRPHPRDPPRELAHAGGPQCTG